MAGFLPNGPHAVVALLAVSGLGAVWVSCPPEFGARATIDRFGLVEPKVLLCADGYVHRGRAHDRREVIAEIVAQVPSISTVVMVSDLGIGMPPFGSSPLAVVSWDEAIAAPAAEPISTPVPFDHPLYILFSSGTTGRPKAIVHGHGGILLEHLKALGLHGDLDREDRFAWYSTTGWMMWNYLVSGLLTGATIGCFDGDPLGSDGNALWRFASEERLTYLGTSAPHLAKCATDGQRPDAMHDLASLRTLGSTGAPLPGFVFRWVYDVFPSNLLLSSISGGTDVCSAFVGGSPVQPVWEGEISGRYLGARVVAFDEGGTEVEGRRGELVVTEPMPSMPVAFWNDPEGERLFAAYFSARPGVWSHGDWVTITDRGSVVISGRSDATLNRGGVRLGTAEIYEVVEALPSVDDSLAVHIEDPAGGPGTIVLAVVAETTLSDAELAAAIRDRLRRELSPRHAPDIVVRVPALPRTPTGKRLEVPLKRALEDAALGTDALDASEPLLPLVDAIRSALAGGAVRDPSAG